MTRVVFTLLLGVKWTRTTEGAAADSGAASGSRAALDCSLASAFAPPPSLDLARAFAVAQASVAGADHAARGRNNQDGVAVRQGLTSMSALVCDGCGSGQATEVGALLAAQLFAARLEEEAPLLPADAEPRALHAGLKAATRAVLDDLARLLNRMPGARPALIEDHFLFTVVGAWLTARHTCLFALGDGLWGLNGALQQLGPFAGNAPPYLGYALLGEGRTRAAPAMETPVGTVDEAEADAAAGATSTGLLHHPRAAATAGLRLLATLPTCEVQSILLATDGALPLLDAAGGDDPLAFELSSYLAEPRYVANPDNLRRRLSQLSRSSRRPDWEARRLRSEPAVLTDDTTVVIIRRGGGGT